VGTSTEITQTLRSLFSSQRLAVLATHTKEESYANLVAFVASEDLKHLLFATPRATRKYEYLKAESRVALLIDSRSNRDSDVEDAIAVTATGEAQEVEDSERERLVSLYLTRHPHLEDFVRSPSCALIRVKVKSYFTVRRFQEVVALHMDH
jgi:nitroimidazol reductase NimA-like FMN-containing flavoprotein (pyridoxamine 5'-phosphate oxidase superfamily)